jgi:hypothetical protein
MTTPNNDAATVQAGYARIAGAAYITNYATAVLGTMLPMWIVGDGSFSERASRLVEGESLYRWSMVSMSVSWILIIVLAYSLYVTLAPVNKRLAQMALLMETCQAAIGAMSVVFSFASLKLYAAARVSSTDIAVHESVNAALQAAAGSGFQIGMMFLGVGSTIYFLLFYRSAYLPRALAIWGIGSSILFFVVSVLILVFPEKSTILQAGWGPMGIAEIVTGIWLVAGRVRINGRNPISPSLLETA